MLCGGESVKLFLMNYENLFKGFEEIYEDSASIIYDCIVFSDFYVVVSALTSILLSSCS